MSRHLLFVLVFVIASPLALALDGLRPDQADLLSAWEEIQSGDPETQRFEKLEPGLYAFETERFPFSGELRVLNVSINEQAYGADAPLRMGVVEVELVDLPENFLVRHGHSYGFWSQTHILYFDHEEGRWLSSEEWQQRVAGSIGGSCTTVASLSSWLWIAVPVVLILALVFATRKANRQMNTAMGAQDKALAEQERAIRLSERAVELSEESNRVLKEILAALQRPPGRA